MGDVIAARRAYKRSQKDARKLVDDARAALGKAIHEARRQNISQADIAEELGVTREQVRRYENAYTDRLQRPEGA